MKKLKCYLSILLVLSMMLCSTSMFTVNAAQVTETEDVVIDTEANLGGEDELQPMMAQRCASTYYIINLSTNNMTATTYDGAISALKAGKSVWVADENTAGLLANELGYYYDWWAPHQNGPYQYHHYQDGNGSHICYGNLL